MPTTRRRRRERRFVQKIYDDSLARQQAHLLSGVATDRRWTVLGRRLQDFSQQEVAALQVKIQGYIATGRCRVTSGS